MKYRALLGATSIEAPNASCVRKSDNSIRTSGDSLFSQNISSSYASIISSGVTVSAKRVEVGEAIRLHDAIAD